MPDRNFSRVPRRIESQVHPGSIIDAIRRAIAKAQLAQRGRDM